MYIKWSEKIDELKDKVNFFTNAELSKYYGITSNDIRTVFARYNIKRTSTHFKPLKFRYERIREDLEAPCKICISHHKTKRGYILVRHKGKRGSLHSLLFREAFGPLKKGELVRHKCDNPACCELSHLEKGITRDNVNDKVYRNRQTKGTDVNTCILTEESVKEIKVALFRGTPGIILSKIFKVHPATISDIKKNKTWKHISINVNAALKKRVWHYVQNPGQYEISCDKCGSKEIQWSEYEKCIWCPKCLIDTKGTMGIFDGPIPVGACEVMGISLDRWDMINKRVIKPSEYIKK